MLQYLKNFVQLVNFIPAFCFLSQCFDCFSENKFLAGFFCLFLLVFQRITKKSTVEKNIEAFKIKINIFVLKFFRMSTFVISHFCPMLRYFSLSASIGSNSISLEQFWEVSDKNPESFCAKMIFSVQKIVCLLKNLQ